MTRDVHWTNRVKGKLKAEPKHRNMNYKQLSEWLASMGWKNLPPISRTRSKEEDSRPYS